MPFLRAFLGIFVVIAISLLLGWTRKLKSHAEYTYIWLTSITVLLLLRFFL